MTKCDNLSEDSLSSRCCRFFCSGIKNPGIKMENFVNPILGKAGWDGGVKLITDKKDTRKLQQQENHNEFNSITQKVKPENQNQEHNVRKEGIMPINQKR